MIVALHEVQSKSHVCVGCFSQYHDHLGIESQNILGRPMRNMIYFNCFLILEKFRRLSVVCRVSHSACMRCILFDPLEACLQHRLLNAAGRVHLHIMP